ncbi:MAG TPA: DUF333 domain-containing protein [Candidatus Hydrogenedentes bacterium]|nr:DUF333 domain-containing protein [Candidatus Hydrogenedentota bacterium]
MSNERPVSKKRPHSQAGCAMIVRGAFLVFLAAVAGRPGQGWGDSSAGVAETPPPGLNAPNPAALYCRQLGYTYEIVQTPDGQKGICVVAPGIEFDAWDFFKGKVGQEYSYAAQHGYDISTERIDRDGYVEEYAICVSRGPDKEEVPLLELMERNGEPLLEWQSWGSQASQGGKNGLTAPPGAGAPEHLEKIAGSPAQPPASFDWRDYNGQDWVTPIRDQGACGSCWAFSAVGAVEANLNLDYNRPDLDYDLSEQHLVSCDCPGDCGGGWHDLALEYIIDPGVTDESCFPYVGESPCELCEDWQDTAAHISGYNHVTNTAAAYKQALVDYGPLAIALDASEWPSYTGGILVTSPGPWATHAVVLVGYNDTEGYWIIKNSWGVSWGEDGYIRLSYTNEPIVVFDEVYAVEEAFMPFAFEVAPETDGIIWGESGGPFLTECRQFVLTNAGQTALEWFAETDQDWLDMSSSGGTLASKAATAVDVCLNANAELLAPGEYVATITFTNVANGMSQTRQITLRVSMPNYYTEHFGEGAFDLDYTSLVFTPGDPKSYYSVCVNSAGTGGRSDRANGALPERQRFEICAAAISGIALRGRIQQFLRGQQRVSDLCAGR